MTGLEKGGTKMKKLIISLMLPVISANAFDLKDTLFNKQWALENNGQVILKNISDLDRIPVTGIAGMDINWLQTENLDAPKNELIVAVIDSGVDTEHPDLVGRTTTTKWNFLDGNINVNDDMGHGTHVAGVIAANKNALGIVGAADPRIKIMPIKVLNSQVNGFVYNGKLITDVIADAMVFAIKNGAKVINLSLGWPKLIDTAKVRNAFLLAESQNVLVIAAAGNNSKDLPTFPCAYESVICVGSLDNRGTLSDFTNHGSKVDVAAPGEYIVSTLPRLLESRVLRIKNYEVKRGSSQAAPFVTAAIASLKLFHPELNNNEARALLFQTAKKINSDESHFVKFGALDMKSMLEFANSNLDKSLTIPLLKNLTEIRFKKSDRRFSFNLPLVNLNGKALTGTVCVGVQSENIVLDRNCFEVSSNITVNGIINNLEADSHLMIKINLGERVFYSTLVLSRDLNADVEVKNQIIANANFDDMAIMSGDRKVSKLTRVLDKIHQINFPEYFFMEAKKQTNMTTIVSLLTKSDADFMVKNIVLPKVNRVLSIHRQDINLDGQVDYFIYALSAKKDQLLLINLDKNLNPLFNKYSTWSMPLTTFEGLPIDGGQEKFDWVLVENVTLGKVLVPSFMRSYEMPSLDNSKNILDRVIGSAPRIFFINPTLKDDKIILEPRVLDNVSIIKKLRSELGIFSDQSLSLLKLVPQTIEENKKGIIHGLFSSSDDEGQKYYEVFFTKNLASTNLINTKFQISDSLIYPVMNSNDFILTSLINRMTAEFLSLSKGNVTTMATLKNDWENPIISMIGAFEKTLLVESRSSIALIREGETALSLPVYRDSSFPGQNFSETLSAISTDGRPGVFVNSTLIFGERLYAMALVNDKFVRPLNLSINIPEGCVPLAPEILDNTGPLGNHNFTLLCRETSSKAVSLKFLPMSLN